MSDSTPSHIAFQLPLELLQNIFILLADLSIVEGSRRPSGRPHWIAITHVCHYWRSTALSLPELWSVIMIPTFSYFWSQAMIERSSPFPMRINLHISFDPAIGFKPNSRLVLLSASRIRTLSLSGLPIEILTFLNRLCSPSPLESLSLYVFNGREIVDLPEAMCGKNAPHLHRLSFRSSACIRAPLWLLTGITHFTTNGRVLLHDLLNTLRAMPQLEILHVVCTLDTEISEPEVLSHAVLPHLSLLSISASNLRRFVTITSHIDAPPTLRKHLHMSLKSPWEPYTDIFPAVQALFPQDSAPGVINGGLRAAQVTGGPKRGSFNVWSRTFSENASVDAAAFSRKDALFLFTVEWVRLRDLLLYSEPCSFFGLATLCSHLCTAHIEDLTAMPEIPAKSRIEFQDALNALDVPDPVAQWRALLSALPSVKTLRLHRGSTTCLPLLRALSASASLLPLLQKIFVVNSVIRCAAAASAEGRDGVGDFGDDAGFAIAGPKSVKVNLGAELVDVLSGRAGLEVVLVECEVDEEAFEALWERARVQYVNECVYMQAYM